MKVNETLYPTQGNKRGIDYTVSPRAYHTSYTALLEQSCIAAVSRSRYAPYNTQFTANIQKAQNPVENVRKTINKQQSMIWLVGEYNTYDEMSIGYTSSGDYGVKKFHSNYYANTYQTNIPIIVNYDYRKLIGNLYVKVGIKNGSNMFSSFICSLQYYITNYKSNDDYVIIQAFISNIWGGDFYQNNRQHMIAGINSEYITTYDFSSTVEKSYPCYCPMTMQGMNQNLTIQNPPSVPSTNMQLASICNLPVFNCTSPHRMSDSSYGADYYNPSYDAIGRMGGIFGFGVPDEAQTWNCGYGDQKGLTYYLPKENDVDIIRKMAATYGIIINDNDTSARTLNTGTTEEQLLGVGHLIIPIMEDDTTFNGSYIYTGDGTSQEIATNLSKLHESERTVIIVNGGNPYDNGYNPDLVDDNNYVDDVELTTPTLTTIDAFNRSYILDRNGVDDLGQFLWSRDDSQMEQLIKGLLMFGENPINGIIDLRLYPFDVRAKLGSGTVESIHIGKTDTGIIGTRIPENANCKIHLGSCKFFEKYKNFLDYDPFTESELFIPFIGTIPISGAHFIGKKIDIDLIVDYITGAGCAIIFASDKNGKHPVMYKNGMIGVSIPITGDNASAQANAVLQQCLGISGDITKTAGDVKASSGVAGIAGAVGAGLTEVAGHVYGAMSVPTMFQSAGSATPQCALYQPSKPYFIIYRPVTLIPDNYAHTIGYATEDTVIIGECSGFNVFGNVDLTGVHATDDEKNKIRALLESGVFV